MIHYIEAMSSLLFSVLLLTMFIRKQDCAVFRQLDLEHQRRVKGSGLEYIVHKYLNPLRRLTAELPNHAIEMQIEILDQVPPSSSPSLVPVPQRRVIRVLNRHPKKIARPNDASSPAAILKQGPEGMSDTTTIAAPSDDSTTASSTSVSTTETTPAPAPALSDDPSNKPVYMEDLKKALNDLEKRLEERTLPPTTGSSNSLRRSHYLRRDQGTPCGGVQNNVFPNNPVQIRNIDDILQILKKAVHIEQHIPKPSDENLDWVQIKIPKT